MMHAISEDRGKQEEVTQEYNLGRVPAEHRDLNQRKNENSKRI